MPVTSPASTAPTDNQLVEIARAGGPRAERAFRLLLERYQHPVFSLVFRMVRNREAAEDVAQEAFVRAFNRLDQFDPQFKFSNWIFKIASNLAIDMLRKRELDTISLDGSDTADSGEAPRRLDPASAEPSPEERVEAAQLGAGIERALGMLRPEYRTVMILRHVEDRAYEEISEITGLPLGTVKTYLHRARHELREILRAARG